MFICGLRFFPCESHRLNSMFYPAYTRSVCTVQNGQNVNLSGMESKWTASVVIEMSGVIIKA